MVPADSGEKLCKNSQKNKWTNRHRGYFIGLQLCEFKKDWMIKLKYITKIRLKIQKLVKFNNLKRIVRSGVNFLTSYFHLLKFIET